MRGDLSLSCAEGGLKFVFPLRRFAYLEGKAFRHGDIEDVLANLSKAGGGFALNKLFGGGKFRGLDIKRVYFG